MKEIFEQRGSVLVIHVPVELDHHNAEPIRLYADQILKEGDVSKIVFDFKNTVFMDSSGIGVIMGRYRNIRFAGGSVCAVHVNEQIGRIFRLSGLYRTIPVEMLEGEQKDGWQKGAESCRTPMK